MFFTVNYGVYTHIHNDWVWALKFNYPRELIIKNAKWQVVFTRTMDFKDDVLGLCQPTTRTIFIKKGLTERQTLAVFVHEVLHAVEYETGVELTHRIINKIDFVLADILRFNFLKDSATI